MRLWPPILWISVYIASELILLGSHHRWGLLAAGGALALFAFLTSLWLTLRRGDGPRPRWFLWALGGVALCYVPPAVAASQLGVQWAAGALAAAVIPMTAVSLMLATIRSKTRMSDDGHYRDVSGDGNDPAPGIGLDDETPLGDTDQHSDVIEARSTRRSSLW
ncbi:MAG TPA: hypothetical protein VGH67_13110 [Solirubrobacteraceae bacterium]|jgi:hypothetical protein